MLPASAAGYKTGGNKKRCLRGPNTKCQVAISRGVTVRNKCHGQRSWRHNQDNQPPRASVRARFATSSFASFLSPCMYLSSAGRARWTGAQAARDAGHRLSRTKPGHGRGRRGEAFSSGWHNQALTHGRASKASGGLAEFAKERQTAKEGSLRPAGLGGGTRRRDSAAGLGGGTRGFHTNRGRLAVGDLPIKWAGRRRSRQSA